MLHLYLLLLLVAFVVDVAVVPEMQIPTPLRTFALSAWPRSLAGASARSSPVVNAFESVPNTSDEAVPKLC